MPSRSKICFAASEASPLVKTGGLADVAAALPASLSRLGHDVRLFVPLHAQVDLGGRAIREVEGLRDAAVEMGGRTLTFATLQTSLPGSDFPVYLIDCPQLFHRASIYTDGADETERFALFSRAVIESCQRLGWAPDIFHCNDWHTALIPFLLRTLYDWDALFGASKSLLTVHNIGYQGTCSSESLDRLGLRQWAHLTDQDDLRAGRFNPLRTGLIYSDAISTVSPTYAREIQTPELGMGLEGLLQARSNRLVGILNGVDYEEWSPENDPLIARPFSVEDLSGKRENKRALLETLHLSAEGDAPLIGVISRLTRQKGFELCVDVLPDVLSRTDLRLIAVGSGQREYEDFFGSLQRRFPDRVCFHAGFNNKLAHMIEAGSDMFLMPSLYEPCGLNQMYSLRYGTIPIVRRTGGLADSVSEFDDRTAEGTGFVFDHFTAQGLRWALERALEAYRDRPLWERLMKNAMRQNFAWDAQVASYVELYSRIAQ